MTTNRSFIHSFLFSVIFSLFSFAASIQLYIIVSLPTTVTLLAHKKDFYTKKNVITVNVQLIYSPINTKRINCKRSFRTFSLDESCCLHIDNRFQSYISFYVQQGGLRMEFSRREKCSRSLSRVIRPLETATSKRIFEHKSKAEYLYSLL